MSDAPDRPVPLRRAALAADPIDQVRRWIDEAAASGVRLPEVGALTTVDPVGRPSSRMVPIRRVEPGALLFHTSLDAGKGPDLRERPDAVSFLFSWLDQGRQVRFDATAVVAAPDECDLEFAQRPRPAQLRAWSTTGSGTVADRAELARLVRSTGERFATGAVPRPPAWAVVRLVPRSVEVFQADPEGLHDRFRYERSDGSWVLHRLAP